jgi:hypothetical protein
MILAPKRFEAAGFKEHRRGARGRRAVERPQTIRFAVRKIGGRINERAPHALSTPAAQNPGLNKKSRRIERVDPAQACSAGEFAIDSRNHELRLSGESRQQRKAGRRLALVGAGDCNCGHHGSMKSAAISVYRT